MDYHFTSWTDMVGTATLVLGGIYLLAAVADWWRNR